MGDTPMIADLLIRIGPLIGGVILMTICAVAIMRNPAVSNVFAGCWLSADCCS